ncbi:MAG: 3-deoxy-D-manno-octulosonic-acid transferase [Candidatus Midichloriaceae bacterium]|jgi:3-deoxy-D-manno-octulosonic-acid transferase|nr:3-deoxy-D-manno-octulosonic-acid transferase [Candidatus Midichloriaceae bacterium]
MLVSANYEEVHNMMLYSLYFLITWCANPFMYLVLARRLRAGKEHEDRYTEKLGRYSVKRPHGKLIWFHVASVGELNSIAPLVKILEEKNLVLITTVTLNASKVFKKANFKHAIHQFAPIDTPQAVKRFLNFWKPNVGVFVDSELWPNLLSVAAHRMSLINLNGRLSDKSAKNWRYFSSFATYLYGRFSKILPCSYDDMHKISKFVPSNKLDFIGNLKLAAIANKPKEADLIPFKKTLKGKLIIVAASTHPGEEAVILKAFERIKQEHTNLFIIIAPRNPSRGHEIQEICKDIGLRSSIRGTSQLLPKPTDDVYIADTVGEMNLWYTLSEVAIVGGSFVPHGGHNIVEPAKLMNAIIIGEYTANFRDIVSHFIENEAVVIAKSESIETKLAGLIEDKNLRNALSSKALSISDAASVLHTARAIIEEYISPVN